MKFTHRRAVSPIIASLLLIAIAVAAGIIVYVYVNSLAGNLTSGGGNQETQQVQLQAYAFNYATGTGQVLDVFLQNVGSSTVTFSSVYLDGTQLNEWGTVAGPLVAYEADLTVPTTQAEGGCFAMVPASATLTFATTGTPSASGAAALPCSTAAAGACSPTAFCIVPSSVTETGLATSTTPGLAAQGTLQLIIGMNGASCGSLSPPSCPATSGTSHTLKIITATGGVAVISIVAGRSG